MTHKNCVKSRNFLINLRVLSSTEPKLAENGSKFFTEISQNLRFFILIQKCQGLCTNDTYLNIQSDIYQNDIYKMIPT